MLDHPEQARRLSDFYLVRDPGEPPPDPAALGNAAEWNSLGWAVELLQDGADPETVLKGIPQDMRDAMNALGGQAAPPPPPPPPNAPSIDVPALPQLACVDAVLGANASPWLDSYTAFSRQWSPRAYDGFHEACALWLLSTVAARRVRCDLGGVRFTNLYVALVARTSLFAKSTTAKIVSATLHAAGLSWLLAPDDSTPQKFIADLVRTIPGDYDRLPPEQQTRVLMRAGFPAQRGWFYEEFGQKLAAMLANGGFMADFRGILRAFDDCPTRYEYGTITRGTDMVELPYLALLANMTPADMRQAAAKHDAMWNDGFWARFAFVTPPPGTNRSRDRFPEGQRVIPQELTTPLVAWHQRLGVPNVSVSKVLGDDGKPTGRYEAHVTDNVSLPCVLDPDVSEAFYAYHDGLCDLVDASKVPDLDGNYSRFAEKALR
ncbi:MAG: DUF3987 domain-containing protein, partial [Candidatus Paceibacterota bacterium]